MAYSVAYIFAELLFTIIVALSIGWLFYRYASLDLRDRARDLERATNDVLLETKKLRHLNKLILLALQNSGLADVNFDDDGNIVGLNVSVKPGTGELRFTPLNPTVSAKSDQEDS